MGFPEYDFPEEQMKKWIDHIAIICLSEEFQRLKAELETLYAASTTGTDAEEAKVSAFSDALYAFLAEKET